MGQRVVTGAGKPRSYSGDYMKVGKAGEGIVLQFLEQRPHVIGVGDWRDLRVVHEADIDFAIKTRDGRVTLAEAKTDQHLGKSGNVLFEILRINHKTKDSVHCLTLGWSARSPAQYFLYYAPAVHAIYQCKSDDLRQSFQRYTESQRENTRRIWVNTDRIKSTLSVLIPWGYCEPIFTIHDLKEIL